MDNTKKLDFNGIKINADSLKSVAEETRKVNYKLTQEIFFDLETGDVIYRCVNRGDWTQFPDPAVILVCKTSWKCTEQWIADQIAAVIAEEKYRAEYVGEKFDWPVLSADNGQGD